MSITTTLKTIFGPQVEKPKDPKILAEITALFAKNLLISVNFPEGTKPENSLLLSEYQYNANMGRVTTLDPDEHNPSLPQSHNIGAFHQAHEPSGIVKITGSALKVYDSREKAVEAIKCGFNFKPHTDPKIRQEQIQGVYDFVTIKNAKVQLVKVKNPPKEPEMEP